VPDEQDITHARHPTSEPGRPRMGTGLGGCVGYAFLVS